MTAERNAGPGWYEVITPRATTCIAYVHEDGSLYLPEGDALTAEEFAFAAARGNAHRLVRADDQPAASPRPERRQVIYLSTPCAVCTHPFNWHVGGVCQFDDEVNPCDCIAFAVEAKPAATQQDEAS